MKSESTIDSYTVEVSDLLFDTSRSHVEARLLHSLVSAVLAIQSP